MKYFNECPINKDIVILASGESIDDIIKPELTRIADKYFIIAINFQDVVQPHARIWSDPNVTDWIDDRDKDSIYITRPKAFHPKNTHHTATHIDYWFNEIKEGFDTNWSWTMYWLLQLLRKYFPKRKVYIFGMDCHNNHCSKYANGKLDRKPRKANNCKDMPEAFRAIKNTKKGFFDGVYNMNITSKVTCLEYKDIGDL